MLYLKTLGPEDENQFISAMSQSKDFHYPYVTAPCTSENFSDSFEEKQTENYKSFLLMTTDDNRIK